MSWIFTILGWGVAGVFVFMGFFGQNSKQRKEESDKLADGLIQRLKETVDQQGKDNLALSAKLDQTTKELHIMQGRNSVLEGLFNGSENSIMAFLKQAPELLQVAQQNHELAQSTNAAIGRLAEAMTSLVERADAFPIAT